MTANRPELLETWLACGWLGAIAAMVNISARGDQLGHVLANSDPRLLLVDASLLPAVADSGWPTTLARAWVVGDTRSLDPLPGILCEPFPAGDSRVCDPCPAGPGDIFSILYTSGTTGPSKGVCCPHAQLYWWAVITAEQLGVRSDDVLYTTLPMFHIGPLNTMYQALLHGSFARFGERFSASRCWSDLVAADATVTYLLGAMVQMLLKQPERPHDRSHRVKVALAPGTTAQPLEAFRERFGVQLVEGWGSTETNYVIGARADSQEPGTMERVLPGFEAMVVDDQDMEVSRGVSGQLVVRQREPFSFSKGYFGMAQDTVDASRNLWFHSGDRVIQRRDGRFVFVDRIKEVIRRRGENISSFDVEQVLLSHPAVAAAAAVPVPSELGEGDDEVMACVVLRSPGAVSPVELVQHCEGRLAYFAVPRYVEILEALPLTQNGKVRKHALCERASPRPRGIAGRPRESPARDQLVGAISSCGLTG